MDLGPNAQFIGQPGSRFRLDTPALLIDRDALERNIAGDSGACAAGGAQTPPLGARIECVTPHCDPTVNLHDVYHVVAGDTLVEIWPVEARGKR